MKLLPNLRFEIGESRMKNMMFEACLNDYTDVKAEYSREELLTIIRTIKKDLKLAHENRRKK